ncbi:hypothetical protein FOZ63_016719, partial [Perkinsus olseni]
PPWAKEDGKPGAIPFLPLRRFTPISMTGMTLPDSYASTVSTRGMCLATAYTLAGFWKPADGANYCNALTKLAAQHSPTLSAKYDALVREKWAVKSVTNSDFDISHETSTLDLEAMVLLQNDASKAGRGQRSTANYCNNFNNKGPGGCTRKNCPYSHRCRICRNSNHGAAQHKGKASREDVLLNPNPAKKPTSAAPSTSKSQH